MSRRWLVAGVLVALGAAAAGWWIGRPAPGAPGAERERASVAGAGAAETPGPAPALEAAAPVAAAPADAAAAAAPVAATAPDQPASTVSAGYVPAGPRRPPPGVSPPYQPVTEITSTTPEAGARERAAADQAPVDARELLIEALILREAALAPAAADQRARADQDEQRTRLAALERRLLEHPASAADWQSARAALATRRADAADAAADAVRLTRGAQALAGVE